MYSCAVSEPHSKCSPLYIRPSVPYAIGCRLSTLWVNIPLSIRRYLPTSLYLWLQLNCLWVLGSFFISTSYHSLLWVMCYLYVGCMRKRITLQHCKYIELTEINKILKWENSIDNKLDIFAIHSKCLSSG